RWPGKPPGCGNNTARRKCQSACWGRAMNPGLPQSSWTARIGEFTLWSIAGIIVLTAHIAAATVFLRQEPTPAADQGPPAAIMIELAAEPEAINTEEDLVSEEIVDSEEVASKQVEPVVDPLPEPI